MDSSAADLASAESTAARSATPPEISESALSTSVALFRLSMKPNRMPITMRAAMT
jgi:hypothetical protein